MSNPSVESLCVRKEPFVGTWRKFMLCIGEQTRGNKKGGFDLMANLLVFFQWIEEFSFSIAGWQAYRLGYLLD